MPRYRVIALKIFIRLMLFKTDLEDKGELDQVEAHLISCKETTWYIDLGASKYIVGNLKAMSNNRLVAKSSSIKIADGKAYSISGTGEACVSSYSNEIKFKKVLYVPGVKKNLLSVGKITYYKLGVYFDSSHCYILKPPDLSKLGSILAIGVRNYRNGLYKFPSQSQEFRAISTIRKQGST